MKRSYMYLKMAIILFTAGDIVFVLLYLKIPQFLKMRLDVLDLREYCL